MHRLIKGYSLHPLQAALQQRIGLDFNPSRDLLIRRATVGRVVFETPAVGRIV